MAQASADKFRQMGKAELQAALQRARARLQDVEETFNFRFAHTNTHMPDNEVHEHEAELEELRAEVHIIEELLSGQQGRS